MAIMPYPSKPPAKPDDKNKVSYLQYIQDMQELNNSPNLLHRQVTRSPPVSLHGLAGCLLCLLLPVLRHRWPLLLSPLPPVPLLDPCQSLVWAIWA